MSLLLNISILLIFQALLVVELICQCLDVEVAIFAIVLYCIEIVIVILLLILVHCMEDEENCLICDVIWCIVLFCHTFDAPMTVFMCLYTETCTKYEIISKCCQLPAFLIFFATAILRWTERTLST